MATNPETGKCWAARILKAQDAKLASYRNQGKFCAKSFFEYMERHVILIYQQKYKDFVSLLNSTNGSFGGFGFMGFGDQGVFQIGNPFHDALMDGFIQELNDNCLSIRVGDFKVKDGDSFISNLGDAPNDKYIRISIDCDHLH